MIINSISNSPKFSDVYSGVVLCSPKKISSLKLNSLKADTVTFCANNSAKLVDEVVSLAFNKINETKFPLLWRKYCGRTKDDINVSIQETPFKNNLILTLTDGNFDDKSYALFELSRSSNGSPKIVSLENFEIKNDMKTVGMIKNILNNLK